MEQKRRYFNVIVAYQIYDRGIGNNGQIPWCIPDDMKHFKELTIGNKNQKNAVIMGMATWKSIPENRRPLEDRLNIVLTRSGDIEKPMFIDKYIACPSLESALKLIQSDLNYIDNVFIIGGEGVYIEALEYYRLIEGTRWTCGNIFATEIKRTEINSDGEEVPSPYICDRFFPNLPEGYIVSSSSDFKTDTKSGNKWKFVTYKREYVKKQ